MSRSARALEPVQALEPALAPVRVREPAREPVRVREPAREPVRAPVKVRELVQGWEPVQVRTWAVVPRKRRSSMPAWCCLQGRWRTR